MLPRFVGALKKENKDGPSSRTKSGAATYQNQLANKLSNMSFSKLKLAKQFSELDIKITSAIRKDLLEMFHELLEYEVEMRRDSDTSADEELELFMLATLLSEESTTSENAARSDKAQEKIDQYPNISDDEIQDFMVGAACSQPQSLSEEKRRKQKIGNRDFELIEIFETTQEFEAWLKGPDGSQWKKGVTNKHKDGDMVVSYTCKTHGRKKSSDCKASMRAKYPSDSSFVCVEVSTHPHEHTHEGEISSNLNNEIKEEIRRYMAQPNKPTAKMILISLQKTHDKLPTLPQIQNFMAAEKQRTSAFGGAPTSKFTLHDLEEYCNSKKEDRATGHDDTFVSAYRLNEDPLEVAVLWTTQRLMEHIISQKMIQVNISQSLMDGTFKLLWNGYVVQPFGYSDHNKNFTPIGLCLSDIENTIAYKTILDALKRKNFSPDLILGDGSSAITAAVIEIFPTIIRAMCYYHMMKNTKERLASLKDEDLIETFLAIIHLLNKAMSVEQFEKAAPMMIKYWNETFEDEQVKKFINYFDSTYVSGPLKNWYEGLSDFLTNNNGLEANNRSIKHHHTLRKRLPLKEFLVVVEQMVNSWSIEAKNKEYHTMHVVSLSDFDNAYKLKVLIESNQRQVKIYKGCYFFFASEGKPDENTQNNLRVWYSYFVQNKFENWPEYYNNRFKFHMVQPRENGLFKCSCMIGSKKVPCKHSIFVMCELGKLHYPAATTSANLENPRKRGRPVKLTGPLVRD